MITTNRDLAAIEIDKGSLVGTLSDMVRIPSVNLFGEAGAPPAEERMGVFYARRMADLGLDVGSREVSHARRNVWGRLKGTGGGPTILLAGHLDTVGVSGYSNPFEPTVRDGNIHGRGSCDMKAGLAAYLEVVRVLVSTGTALRGDLIVAGVVDEEHTMLGSKDFGLHGPRVDYSIIAEPTSLTICPAHKGQICTTIRTLGTSAHSSMPERGNNAIFHMASALVELQRYADELGIRAQHPTCGRPTFSAGVIRGGQNASSVPDLCELDIDRRTVPGETLGVVMSELSDILAHLSSRNRQFRYELAEPALDIPAFDTPLGSPIVTSIRAAFERVVGKHATIAPFPGSTDAPNFGCPGVICGPGALAQCHSLNEYVAVDEIVTAVRIYLQTIVSMQSL
ncbi:M20 family metallopeptidase (plasmid) [Aminobacter sp. SR38]|jgi:acetylornithine deacetylase|uniref:M20 family metallopeptidase n=1 Tax=Aminobacter sp. SR38 TaxID=2774562 RepID=UPI00177EC5E9|nr:M20 family metallopeptidase [Aminobacter sp. SR38]QOF75104.1 M20 family metallopeptidase [Aminobacter sp. SR38]